MVPGSVHDIASVLDGGEGPAHEQTVHHVVAPEVYVWSDEYLITSNGGGV